MNKLIMKKVFFIFCILACCLVSCQKEGEFSPERKISKIYTTDIYGNRELSEEWIWENNNLERIDYYIRGVVTYSYNFSYQNNRLVSLTCNQKNMRIDYQYEKGHLVSAQTYKDDKLMADYQFTYKNGHMSTVCAKYHYDDKSEPIQLCNPLDFILSYDVAHTLNQLFEKQNGKSKGRILEEEFSLSWKNGDLIKISTTLLIAHSGLNSGYTVSATYDKHRNPFYGAFNTLWGNPEMTSYSKHNITQITGNQYKEIYTYTYDGNFPVNKQYIGDGLIQLIEYEYLP